MRSFYILAMWVPLHLVILCFGVVDGGILLPHLNITYPDSQSSFGPRIPLEGISGYLIPIDYFYGKDEQYTYGCHFEAEDMKSLEDRLKRLNYGWIALVQRGSCLFVDKVKNMQYLGASAVIIGDNTNNSSHMLSMKAPKDAHEIRIPSVSIKKWQYKLFRLILDETIEENSRSLGVKSQLTENNEILNAKMKVVIFSNGKTYSNDTFDNIIIFVVFPFVIVSILCILVYGKRSTNYYQDLPDRPEAQNTMDLDLIRTLPKMKYENENRKQGELCFGQNLCVICLENFENKEYLIKLLGCSHYFHKECITRWLHEYDRCCPVCKTDAFETEPCEENTQNALVHDTSPQ